MALTIAVILKILLPLLILGVPPVPLAVIGASGVTVATVVLTEGWKRSSLAAILGTTGALALTGFFAAATTSLLGFTYVAGSDLAFLTTAGGSGLDLRGVLLAAFILGAVGVLDDLTVTQAVLVDELARSGHRGRGLFATAMRIGRSHIAATINTLFLAYVGGGLPLLVVLVVSRQPGALVFNDEVIATEIVRTIVGSLGIIASVPLTTLIATALALEPDDPAGSRTRPAALRAAVVGGTGVVIAALLILVAVLPLTAGARPALRPDVFDPAGLPTMAPSTGPSPTADTGPAADPALVGANERVPVVLGGDTVGSISVVRWTLSPPRPQPGESAVISVLVRYDAEDSFDLARGEWNTLLADGSLLPLVPDGDGALLDQTLSAGETLDATLSGRFVQSEDAPFIAYFDRPTAAFLLAVRLP